MNDDSLITKGLTYWLLKANSMVSFHWGLGSGQSHGLILWNSVLFIRFAIDTFISLIFQKIGMRTIFAQKLLRRFARMIPMPFMIYPTEAFTVANHCRQVEP